MHSAIDVAQLSGDHGARACPLPPHRRHIALAWSGKVRPRLLPKSLFRESARREQLRAIRTHAKLSLVLVSIDETATVSPEELLALSKTLQLQIRETDLLGWYADNALAILLPDTGDQGARECVCGIRARELRLPLRFEIIDCSEVPFFFGQSAQRGALQPEKECRLPVIRVRLPVGPRC
jgi:hypothetical protein